MWAGTRRSLPSKPWSSINPEIEVDALVETIDQDNIDRLLGGSDLIMDAMDNFPTRYLLNKAAQQKKIPLFHGAISGWQGQATTIIPDKTACLRCVFPRAPPASIFPAIGSTCGVIGSIQVTEAVKYTLALGTFCKTGSCSGMVFSPSWMK